MEWYVAHLGNDRDGLNTRQQILSRFKQIYKDSGEPKGVALFEAIDSEGYFHSLCLTSASAEYCSQLFEEFSPWVEHNTEKGMFFNVSWVAGDERLKRRS